MNLKRILVAVILAGLLAAGFVAVDRALSLQSERRVELALWLRSARYTSVTYGIPLDELLRRYQQAGTTTLMISGTTLQTLMEVGGTGFPPAYPVLLSVDDGGRLLSRTLAEPLPFRPVAGSAYVTIRENRHLALWVESRLSARLGAEAVHRVPAAPEFWVYEVRGIAADQLGELNLGVHPADTALADRWGLRVAVQFSEAAHAVPAATPELYFDQVPAGAPVLWTGAGGVGPAAAVAQAMEQGRHSLLIDHSKPPFSDGLAPGSAALAEKLGYRALKLFRVTYSHSLSDVLTAVRERNMQMVLLQPFHKSGNIAADLAEQTETWSALAQQLNAEGFKVGPVKPIPAYAPPLWALGLAGLAAGAAGVLLLLAAGWPAGRAAQGVTAAIVLLAGGAAVSLSRTAGLQATALLASVLLPAWGAVEALQASSLIRRLAWLAGSAFGAGLLVTALLADSRFVLELQLFRGIKLALIGPSLALLGVVVWPARRTIAARLGDRLRLWHLAAVAGVAIALALLLIRSGQDAEVRLVSDLELQVRNWLEQSLLARPRFKEFLVGWPLLFLAHYAFRRGQRVIGTAMMIIGLIGPASLVNSFAHLHTPLWLSALRGLHGLWIGALLGGAAALVWRGRGDRHA